MFFKSIKKSTCSIWNRNLKGIFVKNTFSPQKQDCVVNDAGAMPSSLILEDVKALPSLKSLAPFFRRMCTRERTNSAGTVAYSNPGDQVARLVERSILTDLLEPFL